MSELFDFIENVNMPLKDVPNRSITLGNGFQNDVQAAIGLVDELLPVLLLPCNCVLMVGYSWPKHPENLAQ